MYVPSFFLLSIPTVGPYVPDFNVVLKICIISYDHNQQISQEVFVFSFSIILLGM